MLEINVLDPSGRDAVVSAALAYVRTGGFLKDMAPRIAIKTESPRLDSHEDNLLYLEREIRPLLEGMGFACKLLQNSKQDRLPALAAERVEDASRPTILIYGHGDVLWGMQGDWKDGRDPWIADQAQGRIYGRGMADNKGQHSINLAALRVVLERRGFLGFNVKILIEMGEETGSPGLAEMAAANREFLKADCLIASDGPRVGANTPTVFLGGRGSVSFNLTCQPRNGAYHSGNWGGLLKNPAIRLSHALSAITDENGRILISGWTPEEIPATVREVLEKLKLERSPGDPEIDDSWGEPSLSGPEQVYGWCNFEILAFLAGRPDAPVNAIPDLARATCQLRYVVGVSPDRIIPALREYLDSSGFADVEIEEVKEDFYLATRTDPANPWTLFTLASLRKTLGREAALQPNFGGSLPNEVFSHVIGMPTIWIPHSYPNCFQHSPDEHMLVSIVEEGIQMMAGLFWDLGEADRDSLTSE